MSVKGIAAAMVVGGGLVIFLGTRGHHDEDAPPPPPPKTGPKWIPQEAAAQLVGSNAQPGPLFDGLTLGGAAPTPEARTRVDDFAKKNDVDLDLEVHDNKLTAIRFGVTFKGGYGLEGADVFALRLHRPSTGHCCVCGPDTWIDSWAFAEDGDVHLRARVKKNRVEARWERTATPAELVARADELLGKDVIALRDESGDRWHEISGYAFHLIEAPMPFPRGVSSERSLDGSDLGFLLEEQAGKVVEVRLFLGNYGDDATQKAQSAMRAQWGPPHVTDSGATWSWKRRDRVIDVWEPDGSPHISIHHPGYHSDIPF